MVLFDEDPVTLISETTNQFHIAPDRESLTRISGSLHALAGARAARLARADAATQALARRAHHLRSQRHFADERHDAAAHAQAMLRMDTEKFRVAKAASDAEVEAEWLASELAALKVVERGLEEEGVEGEGGKGEGREERVVAMEEVDEVVLKLQFFRSLGIDISKDPKTGEYRRAIVRSTHRGDVNVINVDGSMSQTFYTNLFWDSL